MQYEWKLHAYVLMKNHFHLAIETPMPNLVEGMHWLQSTLATRFNRFRKERGHLMQERYQSVLVEDFSTLGRVVDYIHLNPVRARVIEPEQVGAYRWSSLVRFMRGGSFSGLTALDWMGVASRGVDARSWSEYEQHLIAVGKDEAQWERRGLVGLSKGWALGTQGWRKALAEDHAQQCLSVGLERQESRELKEGAWGPGIERCVERCGQDDG